MIFDAASDGVGTDLPDPRDDECLTGQRGGG